MPNTKRSRGGGGGGAAGKREPARETIGEKEVKQQGEAQGDEEREHPFARIARQHWLSPGKTAAAKGNKARAVKAKAAKVKNDVLKKGIWDELEREAFAYRALLLLEGLQTLESYLWPGYSEDASNYHVLLIVLLANTKRREHLETWSIFEDRPDDFSSLFRRILSMTLDQTLATPLRTQLLCFLIHAFQSLDCGIVRKECAPLVSIGIWWNLSSEARRDIHLDQSPHLRKAWRAATKRYEAANDATKKRLEFERGWLYALVLNFLGQLYDDERETQGLDQDQVLYYERFVEFLSDLQSQLPTRRYVNSLLVDVHLIPMIRLSAVHNQGSNQGPNQGPNSSSLLRGLVDLLSHYTYFAIDDQSGIQQSRAEAFDSHCAALGKLQRVALRHFKDKLTVLALSNYGAIDKRDELESHLQALTDDELLELVGLLNLRTSYPDGLKLSIGRKLLTEFVVSTFERRQTFHDTTWAMSLLPTEDTMFDDNFEWAEAYDGSRPLPLPKLNLQYLSAGDFVWRALVLYRCEAFYAVRKDIESALRRLRPERESERPGAEATRFAGFSKWAMPIEKPPSILEVVPALVGSEELGPSLVKAEVSFDVRRLGEGLRRDWDSLRQGDVVFLLAIEPPSGRAIISSQNGGQTHLTLSEAEKLGIVAVRTAEVLHMTDDRGRHVRGGDGAERLDNKRRLQLKLDPRSYVKDAALATAGKPDVYGRINLLLRRGRRENNFKPVLESIRALVLSEMPLPSWLYEVFLGYGDPAGANYKNLPNRLRRVDYRDTFLGWQHLVESLPGKTVEPGSEVSSSFGPPYVLEAVDKRSEEPQGSGKPSKKRRRDAEPALLSEVENFKVSTYKPPNTGPYPMDVPRQNSVRFTPAQVEAIMSGSQPGLTVIVGPPGTGKTDVATQIINNIYHNFPEQRTLLIAHSNQALNQLFAKIVALDIDERHLLRLGHGEEELDTEANFGKHGRVGSFLDNRTRLLVEVRRLAQSLGAPGAHENSAESAGYFNTSYVEPAWASFLPVLESDDAGPLDIARSFPFHGYFSDAPQPLFPPDASQAQARDIALGCRRHIARVFSELADIRPFEILRRERDKANYLLTSEARIIAMTTTHAAIKRGEIASLGFHYDNVVMEEAAQITEIETFIPLALQKPRPGSGGQMPLQRVVLCGDHLQNSPVIQSLAFRHYANLEQSLFSRLVRLGVPTVTLDQQGRARPSIARLYAWRYAKLDNLPEVLGNNAEFSRANAGFRYDYQFINVPDYNGRGEAEPTPHFIQNLGEAEYAVALFQYMRLLGYPADKISILTTYAGQKALIRDVLAHRCAKSPVFGLPKAVATVDKYQGEQNDYIILSLTRTSRVGYLRDVRRMTVALSRARLGLYILGRRDVFEACPELRPAFDLLLARPDKLSLVTGELWPTTRPSGEDGAQDGGAGVEGEAVMEGVEHLGQYVFEMTNTRLKQLQDQGDHDMAAEPAVVVDEGDQEGEGEGEGYYEDEKVEPDILEVQGE